MTIAHFPAALRAAWELLIDHPKLGGTAASEEALKQAPEAVMWSFPTLGLGLGLVLALAGALFHQILPHIGAMVLFALLVLGLLEWKDSGRSLALTASLFELKFAGVPWRTAFAQMAPEWSSLRGNTSNLVVLGVILLKLAALAVIFHAGASWFLAPVLIMNFTGQGALAMERSMLDGVAILPVKRRARGQIWILCGFFLCFFFILAPVAVLVSFGAGFVGIWLARTFCETNFDGVDANIISLAGSWLELLTLFCGLIFLI